MKKKYRVSLEKQQLIFSTAHFITFNQNICERIHGHNYRVRCDIQCELDENGYVVDFIALRDALLKITSQLDHHVVLPTQHQAIKVSAGSESVEVTFENKRWVFPVEDCVLLPIENTTAELLADWIGHRLMETFLEPKNIAWNEFSIGVDENEGQWAFCDFARET